jgi:hypothetical protein
MKFDIESARRNRVDRDSGKTIGVFRQGLYPFLPRKLDMSWQTMK